MNYEDLLSKPIESLQAFYQHLELGIDEEHVSSMVKSFNMEPLSSNPATQLAFQILW